MAEPAVETRTDSVQVSKPKKWGGARPGAGRPRGSKNGSTPAARERLADAAADSAESLLRLGKLAERYGERELAHECFRDARRTTLTFLRRIDAEREEERAARRLEALKESTPKPKPEEPAAESRPDTEKSPPSEPVKVATVHRLQQSRPQPAPGELRWVPRHEQVERILDSMPLIQTDYDPYPPDPQEF